MALGSLRMASLASRRSITSRAGIRRVLPFSVTAIFCLNDVLQDRPDRPAAFRTPLRIAAFSCHELRRLWRAPIADDVIRRP